MFALRFFPASPNPVKLAFRKGNMNYGRLLGFKSNQRDDLIQGFHQWFKENNHILTGVDIVGGGTLSRDGNIWSIRDIYIDNPVVPIGDFHAVLAAIDDPSSLLHSHLQRAIFGQETRRQI
jgi:hypothetical protein